MPRSETVKSAIARPSLRWRMWGRCWTDTMPRHQGRNRRAMAKLGRDEAELDRLGAIWTAREIAQQPAMLRKTHAMLLANRDALERFLHPLLDRSGMRVILAGAGTSSFIGQGPPPHLGAQL